jgi:photosystem II stability/assembly factor-like uncharacterized protein
MKKIRVILGFLLLLLFIFFSHILASEIEWKNISRENLGIKTVLVSADNQRVIYFGSDKGLFKTEDNGNNWRNILTVRGQNRTINHILFDSVDGSSLYAATGNGLFYSFNQGKNWNRIFKGKDSLESECIAIAVLPGGIFLGTKSGLFISQDKGRSWHKAIGKLGNSHVLAIAFNIKDSSLYVACVDGVFISRDRGDSWKKVFVCVAVENDNDADDKVDSKNQDEEERLSDIKYITCDPNNPGYVYLATTKGVYKSANRGESWELLSDYGLFSQNVNFVLVSKSSDVYAIAKPSVFQYKSGRWQEISLRLTVEEITFLAMDIQGNLYAACDKGLFKANVRDIISDMSKYILQLNLTSEPLIKDIHKAAIEYAEVEPEKIARWRRQAAKCALLPKITIEMDHDKDKTISSNIWGTYGTNSSPGKYFVGPNDETRYNNMNWGVSLSWDLSDLIWNDNQTSIDVRSRLMVQLRDDILDEVTKLYFERMRTKIELDNLSIEDSKRRLEKELKLQELTASIDALTGGYFSQQIKTKNKN